MLVSMAPAPTITAPTRAGLPMPALSSHQPMSIPPSPPPMNRREKASDGTVRGHPKLAAISFMDTTRRTFSARYLI